MPEMRLLGIAGWSGAGKTTLLAKLIPALVEHGLSVATVKHAHHDFEIDQPGKDSFVHRQAGAAEVIVSSARRFALIHELARGEAEPSLPALLARLSPCDLVLVEGFKRLPHPKLEVFRAANGREPLHPSDPQILAIASDQPFPQASVPVIALDDVAAIRDLVVAKALPVGVVIAKLEAHGGAHG
ncbi:molybdopterin guanine dinucleotide biosynthesis accessory protein MobB [Rhizobiales bacterium GAS113]|nr:molybdopterin guanine dinucleotide biosynthesis accessory protein MobB [Rhizobiales bacterium GAS113]